MTDQGPPAKIAAYEIVRASPGENLEIARQMMTANVTLLATVIGFCFARRTASKMLRDDVAAPVVTRSFHRPIVDPFARIATRNKESSMSDRPNVARFPPLWFWVAAAAVPLGGCASQALGTAVELSTAGSQASAKLLNSSETVETAFNSSITSDRFLRALQSGGVPAGTGCSLIGKPLQPVSDGSPSANAAVVDRIATALHARTDLAAALGKSYSAMNALASYNAQGAVEGGLADVFSATNTLRSAFGLSPVSDAVGAVISAGGGALVQARQVAKLKQASRRLRTGLGYYREALAHARNPSVSLLKDGIGEKYALKIALWRRGYLDANGLVATSGADSGLTVPGAENTRLMASDEALCRGVQASLEGSREDEKGAVESEYDAQIKVIDELIEAHQKFEAGAPLDAAHLAALLDRLTLLAQKIGGKK